VRVKTLILTLQPADENVLTERLERTKRKENERNFNVNLVIIHKNSTVPGHFADLKSVDCIKMWFLLIRVVFRIMVLVTLLPH